MTAVFPRFRSLPLALFRMLPSTGGGFWPFPKPIYAMVVFVADVIVIVYACMET